MKKIKTLSVVYAHHESHGPGIYHNELLAKYSEKLDIFFLNVLETNWNFPFNVRLIPFNKKQITLASIYKKNPILRWLIFIHFSLRMLFLIKKNKYDLIVLFNPSAFLAYRIISPFLSEGLKIWYHNYDPIDIKRTKKFSQGWFAYKAMYSRFPKIELFTHTEEMRNIFFPIQLLKSPHFILPNYPLIRLHSGQKRELVNNTVTLVFSGVISHGNGLEELIGMANKKILGNDLKLVLKGFIQEDYKRDLGKLVLEKKAEKNVVFIPSGPWKEVPGVLRQCNIGIHIFNKADIVSKTMGKGGSGKVFQYIAEGLPVMMSPGFHQNFKEYNWAIATELDETSLHGNISKIISHYDILSQSAVNSFKNELNCDRYFEEIFDRINFN